MMKERTRAAGLLAAGVVAGGILTGGIAANAADQAGDSARSSHVTDQRDGFKEGGPGGRGRPGGPGRIGAAELAKALGVSEDRLDAALKAVREDTKPPERPTRPPSDSERKARREKFVAALAKELDLSEAKVKAALKKVHAAREADRRDDLNDRLAAAVKAGKLTADDRASVLKAFDAGVLGGPR